MTGVHLLVVDVVEDLFLDKIAIGIVTIAVARKIAASIDEIAHKGVQQ